MVTRETGYLLIRQSKCIDSLSDLGRVEIWVEISLSRALVNSEERLVDFRRWKSSWTLALILTTEASDAGRVEMLISLEKLV